jgi:hypothetical protein
LRRRARHLPATVRGVGIHGDSIRWPPDPPAATALRPAAARVTHPDKPRRQLRLRRLQHPEVRPAQHAHTEAPWAQTASRRRWGSATTAPQCACVLCCVEGGCAPPGRWRGRPPPSRPVCMYVPAAGAPSIIVRDRNRRLLGRSQPERPHGRTDATDAAPHVSLGIIIATVLRRCG